MVVFFFLPMVMNRKIFLVAFVAVAVAVGVADDDTEAVACFCVPGEVRSDSVRGDDCRRSTSIPDRHVLW